MARKLSLLKPIVHTIVLQNEVRERVEYLYIPETTGASALKNDLKLGAVQFKDLDELLDKPKEPQYIFITTDNLELGYMAVSYLAAGFNKRKTDAWNELKETVFPIQDTSEYEDWEEWEESRYRIPIISETQIQQELWNGNDVFAMGGFMAQENRAFIRRTPFWVDCKENAVCIVSSNSGGYMGGFGQPNDTVLHNGLELFRNNEKVYIINLDIPNPWMDEDDMRVERGKWNYEILSFAMDEVEVKLEESKISEYYSMIIKGFVHRMDLKLTKNFRLKKIVNIILAMKEAQKCKLIEDILRYAIKDKADSNDLTLSEKDFQFLERFVQTEGLKKKAKSKNSAKEKMLNNLIGMDSVKEQVLNVVNVMKFNAMRSNMKIKGSGYHNVHMMLGAPGTAKTTIAQLMGQIMMEEKLLPDNRFVCVNGAELKGMYVGHSAPKTKALFDEHDIIVIDEAYSIVSDSGQDDSFSKEAIAQLIIELEKHSMDKLVIFAGYGGPGVQEKDNKMKAFLDANPGIKSRITSTIYFESYTAEEMVNIFYKIGNNQNYQIEESAKEEVYRYFSTRIESSDFGNGREARSLLETSVIFAAKRVFAQNKKKYSKLEMQTLKLEDIKQAVAYMKHANGIQIGKAKHTIGFV